MRDEPLFSTRPTNGPVPRRKTEFGMPSSWRSPESGAAERDLQIAMEMCGDDLGLVRATGALNGHTYNEFIDTLRAFFRRGIYRLAIDLNGVEEMTSAGAAACAAAAGIAADNDGRVALCSDSKTVRRFLSTLGLDVIAELCEDAEGGIDALRAAR